MNIESKEEMIASAIYSILSNDNIDTGVTVREIINYVTVNSIRYSGDLLIEFSNYPSLTFKVESIDSDLNLPTGTYLVHIMTSVKANSSNPQTTIKRIMARVDTLIDKKPDILNSVNVNKYVRCRTILRKSSQDIDDYIQKVHRKVNIYQLQCDDEVLIN